MVKMPHILDGKVMHKRLFPKVNGFTYGIYYLAFPLSKMKSLDDGWRFGVNRAAVAGFHEKDHGPRDGSSLEIWARRILVDTAPAADGEVILVTMPRVLGYVFNPVSFWLCHDKKNQLRAVICEVNNTFGERHTYICVKENGMPIAPDDWLEAEKLFHVSPFLKREGSYKFRFDVTADRIGAWIDFYDADEKKQLVTALTGRLMPYTRKNYRRVFWSHPLVSLMAIARIHMQAIRLVSRGIKYISKPQQIEPKISITSKKESVK